MGIAMPLGVSMLPLALSTKHASSSQPSNPSHQARRVRPNIIHKVERLAVKASTATKCLRDCLQLISCLQVLSSSSIATLGCTPPSPASLVLTSLTSTVRHMY